MRSRRALVLVLLSLSTLLGSACAGLPGHSPAPSPSASTDHATVVRVVDGDTVILSFAGGYPERVRLIGIDTPETVKPDTPVQCWGPQASTHLKHLLPPGTQLRVSRDTVLRDKYGRLLLYLWRVSDGLFVNLEIGKDGWGRQLTIPPNTAHEADFGAAVGHAQAEHLGLWGHCPPSQDDESSPTTATP